MPWTFAHPAAVVPLRRVASFSFLGLVAGSIAPDIGYYIGRLDLATLAHRPLGLVTVDLAGGLLLYTLICAMHRPLVSLLPEPHRSALLSLPQAAALTSVSTFLRVALSVVVGAITHLGWDAFTHRGGYVVAHAPLLQQSVFILSGREVAPYGVLQHASTLIGVAVVALVYRRWLRGAVPEEPRRAGGGNAWRYLLLGALALVSVAAAVILRYDALSDGAGLPRLVFRVVVTTTTVFIALVSLSAVLVARVTR